MATIADMFALALQHHQAGELDQAAQLYRHILTADAGHADAHHLLGVLAGQLGRAGEAVAAIRHAMSLNPQEGIYHSNLGVLYERWGQPEQAVECYQQAIHLQPDNSAARCMLAHVLARQGQLDNAVVHYQIATRLKPDGLLAHNNLGEILLKQGRLREAQASFRDALRLQPDQPVVQSNLLFCLNHDAQLDFDTVFAEHCSWGRLVESAITPLPHGNDPDPERRMRIGYVSPDLRYHAVTRYLEPVLLHHDPKAVEVFCYAQVAKPDAVSTRLQGSVHHWCPTCDLSDTQLAQRIHDDRIDLLVDLAGHTANNRLPVFAHKPAPVQVTWLGYLNTTGLTRVDYRLTDDALDPPLQPIKDTEELVRLSCGMCCFLPPADAPAVSVLPALRSGHVTFGSLHSLFKLNAGVYDLWSRLLKALPSSRLLMFRDTLTGTAKDRVHQAFAQRGIAAERLDLRLGSHSPGYMKIFEEIDVILDTFPCTGGVTTCEALWMGAPVLSIRGVRPAGRNSAALLSRVGLDEWAVETHEEFVDLAVRFATDLDRLAALRSRLRERMKATLCSAERFTRELEEAYRTMWRRWCYKAQI
jgi:protein O-GlcNAc transferase